MKKVFISIVIISLFLSNCGSNDSENEQTTIPNKVAKSKPKKPCNRNADYMRQSAIGAFVFLDAKKVLSNEQFNVFKKKEKEIKRGIKSDNSNGKETCQAFVNLYNEIDLAKNKVPKSELKKPIAVDCRTDNDVNKYLENTNKVIRFSNMALNSANQYLGLMEKQEKIINHFKNKKITNQKACLMTEELKNMVIRRVLTSRGESQ